MVIRFSRVAALVVGVLLTAPLFSGRLLAQAKKDDAKLPGIQFVHKDCGPDRSECRVSYALDLEDGDKFRVEIDSTKLSEFTYNIAGVLAAKPGAPAAQKADWDDTSFVQTHDKKYGGYVITIRRKAQSTSNLPDATLIVSVRTKQWVLGFAGGFPVSTIVDRVFSLRDSTVGSATKYLVQEEKSARDRVSLSTATFIHARKNTWPAAATFGLGIGGTTAYYFGPSWMLGDQGAFTLAVAFGSRKDLPAGLRVNELTSTANALTTLPNHNTVGFAVAFSYTFLGTDHSALEKPFKGPDAGTGAGTGTGSPGAAQQAPPAQGTNAFSVAPAEQSRGQNVTLTLKLVQTAADKTFPSGNVSISNVSGPVTIPPQVQLTVSADKRTLEGTFTAPVKTDATLGAASIFMRVDAGGVSDTLRIKNFTVKP